MKKVLFGSLLFISGIIGILGMFLCVAIENMSLDIHFTVYDFPDILFGTAVFGILSVVGLIILVKSVYKKENINKI